MEYRLLHIIETNRIGLCFISIYLVNGISLCGCFDNGKYTCEHLNVGLNVSLYILYINMCVKKFPN